MDRTIHVTTIYKCSCTSTLYNFYNDLYANAVEGGYGGMTLPVFCTDLSVHKKWIYSRVRFTQEVASVLA